MRTPIKIQQIKSVRRRNGTREYEYAFTIADKLYRIITTKLFANNVLYHTIHSAACTRETFVFSVYDRDTLASLRRKGAIDYMNGYPYCNGRAIQTLYTYNGFMIIETMTGDIYTNSRRDNGPLFDNYYVKNGLINEVNDDMSSTCISDKTALNFISKLDALPGVNRQRAGELYRGY